MFKFRPAHNYDYFLNRYEGATATIVGSGPTNFRYEDLNTLESPIFFINDSIVMEKYVNINIESHFVSWHTNIYVEQAKAFKSYFWGFDHPKGCKVFPFPNKSIDLIDTLGVRDKVLDKEWAVRNKLIYMHRLSPSMAVHLAHVSGCEAVQFVGCHPSELPVHDPRINNKKFNGVKDIGSLKQWTELFGYEFIEARTS